MKHNHNFVISERRHLEAIRSTVTIAAHKDLETLMVHLDCPGERENFFAAGFRTPPEDDSGIPHIIEHTVLCGSKKYPVKDPFMEMVKSSMATYINAITYGDRTLYPCGSLNTTDFLNLVSVYMDAVFNPLMTREHFMQEGHRLDFADPGNVNSPLIHSGVVYNEMKGAYSDSDSIIEREISRALFPEGTCGKDSGGDPGSVAKLTHRQIMDFYRGHYHPGNCCLFTLTGIPFDEMASILCRMLPRDRGEARRISFIRQPRLVKPIRRTSPVPEGSGCTALSAWMADEAGDPVDTLSFVMLEEILLDDDSSPVKDALVSSELGTGLSMCGYDSDGFQRSFTIGLKGVKEENTEAVFELVSSTLKRLAEEGIDSGLVNRMLHRKELHMREIGSGWPYALMTAATTAWAHEESIMHSLDLSWMFESLRQRLEKEPDYFSRMISRHLLENTHRADCVFIPEGDHFVALEQMEEEELRKLQRSLSGDQLEKLVEESLALSESMEAPNTPEELATLPKLSPDMISTCPDLVFHLTDERSGGTFLNTPMDTAGVCYLNLCFDVSSLDPALLPLLPLCAELLTRSGADGKSWADMALEELECSGGVGASVASVTATVEQYDEYRVVVRFSVNCLRDDLERMLHLLKRRLFMADIGNLDRLFTVASELQEQGRSLLVPRGHVFSSLYARAGLSGGHLAAELTGGISALLRLNAVDRTTLERDCGDIAAFVRHMVSMAPRTLSWTGPDSGRELVENWFDSLPRPGNLVEPNPPDHNGMPAMCGIEINGGTSFTAGVLPGLKFSHPLYSAGQIMLQMMSEGFLWNEIRVKRGAYGAGAGLGGGAISFYSYRDPSPAESIKLFRQAASQGAGYLDLTDEAIQDSVIACLKGTDPAIRPAMASGIAVTRHFTGITREILMERRSAILSVNRREIIEFADLLSGRSEELRFCVTASGNVLEHLGAEGIKRI
jgi:presequence protease